MGVVVPPETRSASEALPAVSAGEELLVGMNLPVSDEHQALAAVTSDVWPLDGVDTEVLEATGVMAEATWHLPGVDEAVLGEVGAEAEALTTVTRDKVLGSRVGEVVLHQLQARRKGIPTTRPLIFLH